MKINLFKKKLKETLALACPTKILLIDSLNSKSQSLGTIN